SQDQNGDYQGRRLVRALRLNPTESVNLDGKLDEPVWERAVPASDFIQQDPNLGAAATERTEVVVLFDRSRLYLGIRCFDSEPDKLLGNQMQRDQALDSDDRFSWPLDPYLDGRSGYFFEVNPSGAMGDGLIGPPPPSGVGTLGGTINRAWDGIWRARTHRHDRGWTAEIEIPFRTLNFDPKAPAWGANFQRTVKRKNEESLWTSYERNRGLLAMTNAGAIVGISEISQGFGLDVKPYVIGNYIDQPGRALSSEFTGDTGVDFFYSITPQLKANFTVNTDFAETEVDQRRVNLTRFPLFFPEKRDFFVEGAGFFDFSREPPGLISAFFSRRIGLDENGNPQKIDYGVKLTGQAGANNIGALQVRTAPQGSIAGEDFTVFRPKRRLLRQSYVGGIYTRRSTRTGEAADRHTMGLDFEFATRRFRGSDNLEFSGFYVRTSNPLKTGNSAAQNWRFSYPNDRWSTRIVYRDVDDNFLPAVGFVDRSGYKRLLSNLRFSPRPNRSKWIRQFAWEVHFPKMWDQKNKTIFRQYQLTVFEAEFQAGDRIIINIVPTYERLEREFRIRPGITLPLGNEYDYTRYQFIGSTSAKRPVSLGGTFDTGTFYSGRRRQLILNLNARPRPGLSVTLSGEWNRVVLQEGSFSTSLMRMVLNTQFSPWLGMANNVQYDTVSAVLGWQFRLRWILKPGNDLYLVYLHNWLGVGDRMTTLDRNAATKFVYTHRF
ncbi:MAG: carbohydrate binding family 9 domain-containing protein, partial [Acidobacteria bacterium]|nr:carbohydrate binding family 9 domain-containing protein [Acidobacteriota bacterium]